MSIDILLNASILNFVAFSSYSGKPSGPVFALLGIAVAAAEAAVGLAVFLSIYQTHGTIELDKVRFLKWGAMIANAWVVWVILLLPLGAFLVVGLIGRRFREGGG